MKKLLNFRNSFLLHVGLVLITENKIGEWSEDNADRISLYLIDSWKVFETKIII